MTIGDTEVPVASAEDLGAMKILAGRAKDLDDCVAIMTARADQFDLGRTRMLRELLEEALDQSDLLPTFEQCRQRAEA